MRAAIFAAVYVALAVVNFGALNATYREIYTGSTAHARQTCGMSLLLASTPVSPIIVPAFTGLYAYGLSYSCRGQR